MVSAGLSELFLTVHYHIPEVVDVGLLSGAICDTIIMYSTGDEAKRKKYKGPISVKDITSDSRKDVLLEGEARVVTFGHLYDIITSLLVCKDFISRTVRDKIVTCKFVYRNGFPRV